MSMKSWLLSVRRAVQQSFAPCPRRRRLRDWVRIESLERRIVLSLANSPADWMSFLPDNLLISQISIPGTHDSATGYNPVPTIFDKTQDVGIYDQLSLGIRALDIRTRHFNDVLELHHGTSYLYANFSRVLSDSARFLYFHPGETIVMRLKGNEFRNASSTTRSFRETLKANFDAPLTGTTHRYIDFLWQAPRNDPTMLQFGVPTLGQARGKIVLIEDSWDAGSEAAFRNRPDPFVDAAGRPVIYYLNTSPQGPRDPAYFGEGFSSPDELLALQINHLRNDVDPNRFRTALLYTTSLSGNNATSNPLVFPIPFYYSPINYALTTTKGIMNYWRANPPNRTVGIVSFDFVGSDITGNDFDDRALTPTIIDFNGRLTSSVNGLALTQVGGTFDTSPTADRIFGIPFARDVIANFPDAHSIAHLTDGRYGNSFSWIGFGGGSYAGQYFGGADRIVASIAFGRDNTGVFQDRAAGVSYKVQYTAVLTGREEDWTTIGYYFSDPRDPNAALRHRFDFPPVLAKAVRIVLGDTNPFDPLNPRATSSAAIDEIELYGTWTGRAASDTGPQFAGTPGDDVMFIFQGRYSDGSPIPNAFVGRLNGVDFGPFPVQGMLSVNGLAGNDRIEVVDYVGPTRIFGGDGDDFIKGGVGNDYIDSGPGSDTVDGGAGVNFHISPASGGFGLNLLDTLVNVTAGNVVYGTPGNDVITIGWETTEDHSSDEVLTVPFPDHTDFLIVNVNGAITKTEYTPDENGERPTIIVYGGDGDDTIVMADDGAGQHWDAEFHGGPGNDLLIAASRLFGRERSSYLYGDLGDDTLIAGAGNAFLVGGEGSDDIRGGSAVNWVVAGPGNDVFTPGTGSAVSIPAGTDLVATRAGFDNGFNLVLLTATPGVTISRRGAEVAVDGGISFTDPVSTNVNGAVLEAAIISGAGALDQLGILASGRAATRLSLSNGTLLLGSTVIGTVTRTGASLRIELTADVDLALANRVLASISLKGSARQPGTREVQFKVTSPLGSVSNLATKAVRFDLINTNR